MTAITARSIPMLLAAALFIGACDDPTVIEDHVDAEGIAIVEGTTELFRYTLDDGTAVPTLTLAEGTHDVAFVLLDHDGQPLVEEGHDEGEEHVLEVDIADTSILAWIPEAHTDAHDHVEFHGTLDALQVGSTSMEVCVPHGGHCDFRVTVPVTVTAP